MKELNWNGLGTSLAAGRLIARKEPFALSLRGEAAAALRKVAGPGVTLKRELLSTLVSQLSLAALPGLMLYALGSGYQLSYESLGGEGIRIRFQRAPRPSPEGDPTSSGGGARP